MEDEPEVEGRKLAATGPGKEPGLDPKPIQASQPGRSARTGRLAGDAISAGLRQLWADVENEPVPDDFQDMLDAIDAARSIKRAGENT